MHRLKGYAAVRDFWHSLRGAEILLGETIEECFLHSVANDDPRIRSAKERNQKAILTDAFETMNRIPTRPTLSRGNFRRRRGNEDLNRNTDPVEILPNPLLKDQKESTHRETPEQAAANAVIAELVASMDQSLDQALLGEEKSEMLPLLQEEGRTSGAQEDFSKTEHAGAQEEISRAIPKLNPNQVRFVYDPKTRTMQKIGGEEPKEEKTAGAAEAQLTSRRVNGIWEYYWTIAPLGSANLGVIAGTGGTSGGTIPSSKPIYIMAQPVAAYVLMPKVNLEMGYETVGTLHERRGENQILNLENMSKDKGQIWTRIFGRGLNEKGKERFEYENDIYGVQAGYDFKINEDLRGNTHLLGGYIAYNRANTDFFDRYRAENGYISDDKFTGKGKSESISLGLTKTKYTPNGSYYDLVGQMSFLQNKYDSRDNYDAKQKGYGLLLSAEVGRPFKFSKNTSDSSWSIEPQAQLIYQYLHTKSFNDGLRDVNQDNRNGLRARAGVRISYDKNSEATNRTNTYYAIANVWHDLIKNNNKYANIGLDKVGEKYGTTWGEIGIGAQAPVGQKSNLYVDTRYEHSFGNEKRSGYKGTIGFKHTF